jgi:hypothetical protein
MKIRKRLSLSKLILSILLIFTSLFASACFFDPDEAVNLKDSITKDIVVQSDSTKFYFYYHSEEHPIEEYEIIKIDLEYYVDYRSFMKEKDFFIIVPDDVQYDDQQPYFTAEIDDALTDESVVYVSVHANYKKEDNSRFWLYLLAVVIALALLIVLCSVYMVMCESMYSNSLWPSLMWLGGLIAYILLALLISSSWGTGPASIIIVGGILYFICTLFTFFKYKD